MTRLEFLESESIQIIRETAAEFDNPVMLYSAGKDSTVLLELALRAFAPCKPPFPLLHIDTGWKFRQVIRFRDETCSRRGLQLIVHVNPEGLARGIGPITHGSRIHTEVMKTEALKQALDSGQFDAVLGGARRDEDGVRAKERIYSHRGKGHHWNPRLQRPEPWGLFNSRLAPGESMRVFPLSNWTETDIWLYIHCNRIPVVPLYFAAQRPVLRRNGELFVLDDDRMPLRSRETVEHLEVRFRTLGCWPLTAAIESSATDIPGIIAELHASRNSERAGRIIDHDKANSMERKKQEGYF